MLETEEATDLEALQARKLAEARDALRAYEEAWEAYQNALALHERALKEHAERKAAFVEQAKRFTEYVERWRERQELVRQFARMYLRLDSQFESELAEILAKYLEPSAEVRSIQRQTILLPRKRGTAIAFKVRDVPPEGLKRRVRDRFLRFVPRANRFLYRYAVGYTRSYRLKEEEELLAVHLALYIGKRAVEQLVKAIPRGEAPLVPSNWVPLQPTVFFRVIARLLAPRAAELGAVESNNPAESKKTLEENASLRAHLLFMLAQELIRIANEELLPPLFETIPAQPRDEVAPPVDPGPEPEEPIPPRLFPRTNRLWEELPWEAHVARLKLDERRAPSQHLLLGYEPLSAEPILLARTLLHAHAHVVGATQTGKTSAALIPLVTQLIRGSDEPPRAGEPVGPPPPILIIDLKGDFALFNTARLEAKRRGRAFHFFTTHPEKDSHVFDIFGSLASLIPTPADLGGFFAQAFDIFHGPGYGHGYYSKENREALVTGVDRARERTGRAPTLTSLGEALATTAAKKTGHDAREAQATLAPLVRPEIASRLERNEGTDPARVIHMPTAIEEREVLYFWIPVLRSTAGLDIARLALYSFMHAVAERHYTRGERRAYAIIDEFQEVASFNIGRLLTFSAGVGLSMVMANQSVQNLKVGSTDIRDHVTTNANLRLFFSVASGDDIEELQMLSGEKTVWARSRQRSVGRSHTTLRSTTDTETFSDSKGKNWGQSFAKMWSHGSGSGGNAQGSTWNSTSQEGASQGETSGESIEKGHATAKGTTKGTNESESLQESRGRNEMIRPALDANEILDASLVDRACLVHSKRDAGDTLLGGRPRPIRCLYSMDAEEYGARRSSVWPCATVRPAAPAEPAPAPSPAPPASPSAEPAKPPKEHPKRRERGLQLQKFFDDHAPPSLKEE